MGRATPAWLRLKGAPTLTEAQWQFLGTVLTTSGIIMAAYLAQAAQVSRRIGRVEAAIAELSTKVTTLWDIYVMDALRRQRDVGNIEHHSEDVISQKFVQSIRDQHLEDVSLTPYWEKICRQGPLPAGPGELAFLITQAIGVERAAQRAERFNLGIDDWLAIAATVVRARYRDMEAKGELKAPPGPRTGRFWARLR